MGAIRRWLDRLTQTDEARLAEETQDWASSIPGAHGFTSEMPAMVTVGSPTSISRRARPPFPAPTIATVVTEPSVSCRVAPQLSHCRLSSRDGRRSERGRLAM